MLKAGFISLGCAKNLVDTEVMLGLLAANQITITEDPQDADILIINTCTFIESAKEELRPLSWVTDDREQPYYKRIVINAQTGEKPAIYSERKTAL